MRSWGEGGRERGRLAVKERTFQISLRLENNIYSFSLVASIFDMLNVRHLKLIDTEKCKTLKRGL